MSWLQVDRVTWRVGEETIVEDASLSASAGECIAVMGRNGAGKSTLLDMIAGLRHPTRGEVSVDGAPLSQLSAPERARQIGHLPQLTPTGLPFSVEQIVAMGRYPHSEGWLDAAVDRDAVVQAMIRCQCLQFRHRRFGTLSGGERQRVMLAACLAQQPTLLLLDEPSTFLDIDQQLHCFGLLRQEAMAGRICIAVTHDVNLALAFCTRVVLMADGRIVLDAPVALAVAHPEWLHWLSSRLSLSLDADGRPSVSYR